MKHKYNGLQGAGDYPKIITHNSKSLVNYQCLYSLFTIRLTTAVFFGQEVFAGAF